MACETIEADVALERFQRQIRRAHDHPPRRSRSPQHEGRAGQRVTSQRQRRRARRQGTDAEAAAALLLDDARHALNIDIRLSDIYRKIRCKRVWFGVASERPRRIEPSHTREETKMNFRRMMAAAVVAAGGLWSRGPGRRDRRLVGFPRRRRRRAHEEADQDFNAAHAGKVEDRGDDARLGHALLRQGADLGRRRRGAGHDDLSRQPHPAGGQPGHPRRDHRRRHGARWACRPSRLRPGDLGRGDRRRQAICGAARYPPDRALLQQGHADEGRPARRRRHARRAWTATTNSPPRCRS